jgi:iron complex outermembrane receptor protein
MSRDFNSAAGAGNQTGKSAQWMAAASALAIVVSIGANPAFAADSEPTETLVGEVVVTARKVAENIQDVPVAITAVS